MSSKPGRASAQGRATSVRVSPTLVSATFLMVATKKPTSPAESSASSTGLGVMTPMLSTSNCLPFDMTLIFMPLRSSAVDDAGEDDDAAVGVEPAIENQGLQRGFGVPQAAAAADVTTASRMSATLRPVLAETAIAPSAGRPTDFSIISLVRSMSALTGDRSC